jgi:hypothetical protein
MATRSSSHDLHAEHVSLSRLQRRARCERMDWWQTEGARGGYRRDASPDARMAYALKKLTSLPAVVGDALHHAAATRARRVRDGMRPPTFDALLEMVRDRLNTAVCSRNVERFLERPGDTVMLREVFFEEWPDGRIPSELVSATRTKVESLLRAMVRHPVWEDLAHCSRGDILICDSLDALEIEVNGSPVRVYAAPDLIWISHERREVPGFGVPLLPPVVTILDWKSGRPHAAEEHGRAQLAVYAWWATQKLILPVMPAAFVGRIANLGAMTLEDHDCQFVLHSEDVHRGGRLIGNAAAAILAARGPDGTLPMDETARSPSACQWCAFTPLCRDAPDDAERRLRGTALHGKAASAALA